MDKVSSSPLSWLPALPEGLSSDKIKSTVFETFQTLNELSGTTSGRALITAYAVSWIVSAVQAVDPRINNCYALYCEDVNDPQVYPGPFLTPCCDYEKLHQCLDSI